MTYTGKDKYCPDCETILPLDEFNKNKGRPDGHSAYCRKHDNIRKRKSILKKVKEECRQKQLQN